MYVIIIKKEEINDMKKFISSILILGFTVMPMSYVVFAQEGTAIVSEVQTENEAIKEGMFTKGQTALATQEDNNIGKQSEDLKEDEDAQAYTKEFQYATMLEETQQYTQEKNFQDVQKDAKTNEDFKSFQLSPETKSKLKKIAVPLSIVVVGAVVNCIVKNFEDKFNDCNKVSVERCWSAVKSDVSVEDAGSKYEACKDLAKNEYCFNKYILMNSAKILDFAFKLGKFILDTYRK